LCEEDFSGKVGLRHSELNFLKCDVHVTSHSESAAVPPVTTRAIERSDDTHTTGALEAEFDVAALLGETVRNLSQDSE